MAHARRALGHDPDVGTLEHFLTERYCLYAVDHTLRAYRLEVHHPGWALESAEAEITVNTMAGAARHRPAVDGAAPPLLKAAGRGLLGA